MLQIGREHQPRRRTSVARSKHGLAAVVSGLLLVGWGALTATPARADSMVLLPLQGQASGVNEPAMYEKVAGVLEREGFEVIKRPKDACSQEECVQKIRREARADFALVVALWQEDGVSTARRVAVDLYHASGRFPGVADAPNLELYQLLVGALGDARQLLRLGPGPWIRVSGEPLGAQVKVDGRVLGTLPNTWAVPAGRHVVVVESKGLASFRREVDLPVWAPKPVDVEVNLEEANLRRADVQRVASETSAGAPPAWWRRHWVVGPIALSLVSAGFLVTDAVALVRRGCDGGVPGTECDELRDGAFAAYAAVGAAAAVAAVLWGVLGRARRGKSSRGASTRSSTAAPASINRPAPIIGPASIRIDF